MRKAGVSTHGNKERDKMGDLYLIRGAKLDICDYCQQYGSVESGQMTKDSFNEEVIFKCFNCLEADRRKDIPAALTPEDQNKAGWCDHGRRTMSQGLAKSSGKPWRKEDCSAKVCEPIWWYWQSQIRCWISPRENNDYL
jgi:hypothetical protein